MAVKEAAGCLGGRLLAGCKTEVAAAPGAGLGVETWSLMGCWGLSIPSLKDSGMGLALGKEAGAMGLGVGGVQSRGEASWGT